MVLLVHVKVAVENMSCTKVLLQDLMPEKSLQKLITKTPATDKIYH